MSFQISNLVTPSRTRWLGGLEDTNVRSGIVIEANVEMWGGDGPPGVKVLWDSGEIENVYEDEIVLVKE